MHLTLQRSMTGQIDLLAGDTEIYALSLNRFVDAQVMSIYKNRPILPGLIPLDNRLDDFSVVHVFQSLIEILDGVDLAKLVHWESALPMKLNELGDELVAVRVRPNLIDRSFSIGEHTSAGFTSPSMTDL